MSGTDPKTTAPPPSGPEKVTQLKEQIATRTYRVDSQAVAREMLFKMRMMALLRNLQRHQPVSGAEAPSPTDPAHRRSWSNPDGSRDDPSA
jgi:hypothetical protein